MLKVIDEIISCISVYKYKWCDSERYSKSNFLSIKYIGLAKQYNGIFIIIYAFYLAPSK